MDRNSSGSENESARRVDTRGFDDESSKDEYQDPAEVDGSRIAPSVPLWLVEWFGAGFFFIFAI